MKVIVAFDSFKGCMDAARACRAAARGIAAAGRLVSIVEKPMADGGEGTAGILLRAKAGQWIERRVAGPLPGVEVDARFAWFPKSREAVVDMAAASGLELLSPDRYDPRNATTRGTGELIAEAIRIGAGKIMLAVGGSATMDGGAGALSALGWRFLDSSGVWLIPGGGELERIAAVFPPSRGSPAACPEALPEMVLLCDVENTLCGEEGAARRFGPQKGADPDVVELVERGLLHLARLAAAATGREILDLPCGGSGGGIAAGLHAFLGAEIRRGASEVIQAISLESALADADCVVTGEGCFDEQSLRGKVVSAIAARLKKSRTRLFVLAGRVALPPSTWRRMGIEAALPITKRGEPLAPALACGEERLFEAGRKLARDFFISD